MRSIAAAVVLAAGMSLAQPPDPGFEPLAFVNFEHPHVHPLELTPDGQLLLAVNTADNALMLFDVSSPVPTQVASIPVGLDPVSVRARTSTEAWVANHLSDTVSVVDLVNRRVVATVQTLDEPADVVFAGDPERAFVSASQTNRIQRFDPQNLAGSPTNIFVNCEDPRALAVSLDGLSVYAACFESGNGTTIVSGGKGGDAQTRMGDGVEHGEGPYGGQAVPPNDGSSYTPPINPALPTPAPVSMIVRKNGAGAWLDDNGGDWTRLVSGDLAEETTRVVGWELPDRDVAIIDTASLSVTYRTRLMNALMAIDVNPQSGHVTVVGTDATNEVRWEPNLNGRFLRVNLAFFQPTGPTNLVDLNPHLDYATASIPQAQRDLSIGDPRGIAWSPAGDFALVTGMGSNNVVLVDEQLGRGATIEVGEGPTGIVVHAGHGVAYVLNKFEGSLSVVDLGSRTETQRVAFFDPTPQPIRIGRRHLYSTHTTSGLGHVSCASCHIDARTDRLAWDLGNPAGEITSRTDGEGQEWEFHPMKGPMKTQSLQDIIGVPAMHHSGDRADLSEFADAFANLQGADAPLDNPSMAEFEAMLDSVHLPPNPFRNIDNSLSTNVPLPGPNGTIRTFADAQAGKVSFFTGQNTSSTCGNCHLGPRSRGDIEKGPGGFIASVPLLTETFSGSYERLGWWARSMDGSTAGFGFRPDAAQSSEFRHTGRNFPLQTESGVDVLAYIFSIEGPQSDVAGFGRDAHAGVGQQVQLGPETTASFDELIAIADSGNVELVGKGMHQGEPRGFLYAGAQQFETDRLGESVTRQQLSDGLLFTLVPAGSGYRIGLDADLDGVLDGDERDLGSDPRDPFASSWIPCADDGEACTFTGTQPVRYGSDRFLYGIHTAGALCSQSLHGDPDTPSNDACWTVGTAEVDGETTESDLDADGTPDSADCAPIAPGVHAPPAEIGPTLRIGPGTELTWQRAPHGHVTNLYADAQCLAAELPATTHIDAGPTAGLVRYLATARNRCAEGSPGIASSGTPRTVTACPTLGADTDADSVLDIDDNCPLTPNPDQADQDLDGVGDVCE